MNELLESCGPYQEIASSSSGELSPQQEPETVTTGKEAARRRRY